MAGLTGLTPAITPVTGLTTNPELTAEERLGGPADPRHADPLAAPEQYPWAQFPGETHGPYGAENGLLGVDIAAYETPAGTLSQDPTGDLQPRTNAAPWPKGVEQNVEPAAISRQLDDSRDIHASNMGQSRRIQTATAGWAQNDDWVANDTTDAGASLQVPTPQQVQVSVGGFGNTDRVQSQAAQNEYGFDAAHVRQRYADGTIPGNYQMMIPGSRPLVMTQRGIPVIPVGQDSPFQGQIPGAAYDTQGSVLVDLPVSYAPPVSPALAPDYSQTQSTPEVSLW